MKRSVEIRVIVDTEDTDVIEQLDGAAYDTFVELAVQVGLILRPERTGRKYGTAEVRFVDTNGEEAVNSEPEPRVKVALPT